MLTLRIANPSARRKVHNVQPKRTQEPGAASGLTRQQILDQHLNKCYMKVGDRVALKKPRNPRLRGTLINAGEDAKDVVWVGNQPKFLTVAFDIVDKATGRVTGTEIRNVGVKQLIFTAG